MTEEWSPAAPELTQHFDNADSGTTEEARRSYSAETVTTAQRDQLENQRSAPALEEHLRMGGPGETAVHQTVDMRNESQLAYVDDRLASAHAEMTTDFERNSVYDKGQNFDRTGGQGRER